jgi:asparagine synthase (glutamine-hydrolyzing)
VPDDFDLEEEQSVCGIVGWVGGRNVQANEAHVREAVSRLKHRGPDGNRVERMDGRMTAILGSTRLRVLDLSPNADMPMSTDDGLVRIAYNGELFNHRELRSGLRAGGHNFKTGADTECLVHLYEDWADDVDSFLAQLRGMFAVTIWDARRQRLILARDRLGIKPMVYSIQSSSIAFASESRSLVASGLASDEPDRHALGQYIQWGWIPGPRTAFRQVTRLPPGHYLTWSDKGAELRRWWKPTRLADSGDVALEDAVKGLGAALDDGMRRHVDADRPVGVFLSSGIDSGVVATLAAKHGVARGITVTFPEVPSLDEASGAHQLAARLGIEHIMVPITGRDLAGSLSGALAGMDQPTVDSVNTWLVSRAAAQSGLVVALSGLGGDELFSGYGLSLALPRALALSRVLSRAPSRPLEMVAAAAAARRPGGRASRIIGSPATEFGAYRAIRGLFGVADLHALGVVNLGRPDDGRRDGLDAVTSLDLNHYLPDQLLLETDAASMSHSLEVRVPLLDDAFVEEALGLPIDLRIAEGKRLITAATGFVPQPKKRGFVLPYEHWLKGSLRDTVREALLSEQLPLSDFLRHEGRKRVWEAFIDGRTDWRRPWAIAVLRMWPTANGLKW